jgi:hypothetical protein
VQGCQERVCWGRKWRVDYDSGHLTRGELPGLSNREGAHEMPRRRIFRDQIHSTLLEGPPLTRPGREVAAAVGDQRQDRLDRIPVRLGQAKARGYNRLMRRLIPASLLLSLSLAACASQQQATPTPPVMSGVSTAQTAVTSQVSLPPTPPADCVDDAAFVADLTLPDGIQVTPGERLVKQWSVQNTGSCDWGPDYRLVPILPNPMAGDGAVALYPARAGTQAVWQVTVQAPESPGEAIGRWQAQAADGTPFGEQVYIVIEVSSPTASPTAETTVTP